MPAQVGQADDVPVGARPALYTPLYMAALLLAMPPAVGHGDAGPAEVLVHRDVVAGVVEEDEKNERQAMASIRSFGGWNPPCLAQLSGLRTRPTGLTPDGGATKCETV